MSHFHGRCAPFAAECAQSVDSRVIIAAECIQYARELLQDATKCRMMFTNACLHINKTDTRPLLMLGLLGLAYSPHYTHCGIFPPLYTLHTCHYYIPPLFSLDELGLARLGVAAKAPAPTVLASGRLALAQAAGGNGSLHTRGGPKRSFLILRWRSSGVRVRVLWATQGLHFERRRRQGEDSV